MKPTAHSTVKQMKDYIRSKKLNRSPVRLGMRKPEMVAALKKMGHWDPKHDKSGAKVKKKQFNSAVAGLKSIMAQPSPYSINSNGGMDI
tara:strand:+ start:824 stop:1090 length:267 start_codon:yes stop_codon:yes gene_type:complete